MVGASIFGRPFVKRFALCYQTIVCPACDVGVLPPNGWTEQDETWHAGSPGLRPHCVRWGPSSPQKGHSSPSFRPISVVAKLLDGSGCLLVGGRPCLRRHCVTWGLSSPQRGTAPNFCPMSIVAKYCFDTVGWAAGRASGL